jgi:hypothetical protein
MITSLDFSLCIPGIMHAAGIGQHPVVIAFQSVSVIISSDIEAQNFGSGILLDKSCQSSVHHIF